MTHGARMEQVEVYVEAMLNALIVASLEEEEMQKKSSSSSTLNKKANWRAGALKKAKVRDKNI